MQASISVLSVASAAIPFTVASTAVEAVLSGKVILWRYGRYCCVNIVNSTDTTALNACFSRFKCGK